MLLLAKDYCESRRLESGTNITLPWIFFYHGSFSSSTIPHYDPINQSKKYYIKKELARLEGSVLGEQPQSCLLDTKAHLLFELLLFIFECISDGI